MPLRKHKLFESTFIGCTFDYVVFERTFVDPEILETGCPGLENMKMRFARTLRMNYQQIGDAKAANAAMNVELQATAAHLTKAWRSNESYYRKKYTGWRRAKVFGQWIDFKVLDFVWGNGESLGKLLRAVLAVLVSISLIDVWLTGDGKLVGSYVTSMERAPQLFLGTMTPAAYPAWYVAVILFLRLVAVSFFVTIVIKRFSRR